MIKKLQWKETKNPLPLRQSMIPTTIVAAVVAEMWRKKSKRRGMFGKKPSEQQPLLQQRVLALLGNRRYDEGVGGLRMVELT